MKEKGILAAGILLYLGFTLPLIPVAAQDARMVGVFSLDEFKAVNMVHTLYVSSSWEPKSYSYGGLFYYLPLLLLKIWALVGTVNEHLIVILMRSLCTLAGIGCLWLSFRLGKLLAGETAGVITLFLLLVTPTFLRWSVEIHPDLPQLFWMLASLWSCIKLVQTFHLRHVVLAALFAGLAFGTKYGGLFLTPILAFTVIHTPTDRPTRVRALGWIALVFLATALVTNPYAVLDFETFKADILFERDHLASGHMFQVERAGLSWLLDLGHLVGLLNGLIGVGYGVWIGLQFWKHGKRPTPEHRVMLAWVALYMLYLILNANLRAPRHLLPIAPIVMVFVGSAYREIAGLIQTHRNIQPVVILVLIFLVGSVGRGTAALDLFDTKKNRAQARPEIAAGQWMSTAFPPETTILFDGYAYVPTQFQNALPIAHGQNYPVVNHLEPDILVVRENTARQFQDLEQANQSRIGKDLFLDTHYFYQYLKAGHIPTYRQVKNFGGVTLYQRTASRTLPDSLTWEKQVHALRTGTYFYGYLDTRKTMGDVAFHQKDWNESIRNYRLALNQAPKDPVLHYVLGRSYLAAGQNEAATDAFNQVLEHIRSRPADYRAGSRLGIAQQYFLHGFYPEAIEGARQAIAEDATLQDAHFNLGAFYLAAGDHTRADSAYAEAVRRFGPSNYGKQQLQAMVQQNMAAEEAQRLLRVYFDID
ncbi:MAG: glycosyltransferase family 39 protein [bacterium]|nr:glycosyltransferase family 39 protein [bacterium]